MKKEAQKNERGSKRPPMKKETPKNTKDTKRPSIEEEVHPKMQLA
jgi:hypothetical protein